ncbi:MULTISPECIES: beta family protein [Polaromonas]|uniref:Beta protein n=1 Tax=Polaromonas aquatica TaxID=332657 RepID=A0ABW1U2J6_9BURK
MPNPRYTPFLKLKANEIAAYAALSEEIKQQIKPFFDLARRDGMTEASFCGMVTKAKTKVQRYLGKQFFFLDNYDISDDLSVNGKANYEFVIETFRELNFIPVIGLNRTDAHNKAVFVGKKQGLIKSDTAAIRLEETDFELFELVKENLTELLEDGDLFQDWVLILDCGMCRNVDAAAHAVKLATFIKRANETFEFTEIIVTGSSIPASIADVAKVQQREVIARNELLIYRAVLNTPDVGIVAFGDYTVVSPLYSDITIPPEMMRNVTAPKVLYSHEDQHLIARGGALKTHARGSLQYNDIAGEIVKLAVYRGPAYSFGDNFLHEKAQMLGKQVTPGSILNPTINAHITYMVAGHPVWV